MIMNEKNAISLFNVV